MEETSPETACPSCGTILPSGFRFCSNCGHRIEEQAPPQARDERRDVTVLFADVSGFTAMSERLDPEQVHEIMNACFDGLGQAIQREGGHIDKYIGDNVMALFGAPVAHEDDPKRAARAALAMQEFLAEFAQRNAERAGVVFRMRIGIHCGLVLAGNVGASVRRDYSVMGDTVNVASRLESAAQPGHVLVSHEFMRRNRGQFAFGPVTHLTLKGKTARFQGYELLRELTEIEGDGASRKELPFVGRRDLVEGILNLWSRRPSHVSWIWVAGPSGIGKTRLVEEAASTAHVHLLRVTARPSTQQRPLGLARRMIQSAVSAIAANKLLPESFEAFTEDLSPAADGLESYLEALWYLAAPDHMCISAPDPDPQTLRRTLQYGFARLFANLAKLDPDAIVFADDFDYCDAASADLLARLPETGLPPIIVAARTPATERRKWHVVDVAPLASQDMQELLSRTDHARALSLGLRADLIGRAGGVPLYMEEMLLKLVDEVDASSALLPESLFGAMVARADALAPTVRRLLLECAVQGLEFSADVAAEVSRAENRAFGDVSARVMELSRQQLVDAHSYRAGYWSFRQSLMQAACYETLLLSERKRLHQQTALALATVAGGAEAVSPTVLAHHLEAAESWTEAAGANLRAGARSAEIFSNDEAKLRYARAIEQAGRAASEDARTIAVAAHDGAARLCLRLGEYGEVERLARQLLEVASTDRERAFGHRHMAAACFHTGRMDRAREHLLEGLRTLDEGEATNSMHRTIVADLSFDLAQVDLRAAQLAPALDHAARSRRFQDPLDQAASIRLDLLDGRLAHTEGRFSDAVRHYTRAYEAADRLGSVSEQARSCNNMGDASRDAGNYPGAQEFFAKALAMWERIGDAEGVAGARNNLANLAMSRGDWILARHHHRHALEAFEQIGNVHGSALSRTNLAILAIENGEAAEAIDQAQRALALLGDTGSALLRALTITVLGDGHLMSGAIDTAEQAFHRAIEESAETPPPLVFASVERGLGRVALLRGAHSDALKHLETSLEGFQKIGRAQEAARTLLLIAETQSALGNGTAAIHSAAAACEQFSGIGAERDREYAKALLDRLGGGDGRRQPA